MILAVIFTFLQLYGLGKSSCPICTNISHYSHLVQHDTGLNTTFMIFADFGFLRCIQQCLFRARCQSINFDISSQICELNEDGNNDAEHKNGSIFTEMSKWPQGLALQCKNHACPYDKVCRIITYGRTRCYKDAISPLDKGYTKIPNLPSFFKLYTVKMNYTDARDKCHDDGGRLVELDSNEKNTYIRGIIQDFDIEWVYFGATDMGHEGDWIWDSTKQNIKFNDWGTDEPNDYKDEDCAAFWKKCDWQWNDIQCRLKTWFVCEIAYL